jgi:hypothetical protein
MAARLFVELGTEPTKAIAIAIVRAARPGAIETLERETFVLRIATMLR